MSCSVKGPVGQRYWTVSLDLRVCQANCNLNFLLNHRLVVEGEVVSVYHTLENSRVYHEKDLDSVEFGLEVRWSLTS